MTNKYLNFIEEYWPKVTQFKPDDVERIIGLPFPYVSPNTQKYPDLYYWDSYFHILGLLASGHVELARGIVDNFVYLINRFGIIPNANCFFFLSRSQPPFLSSMILEVFSHTQDNVWLAESMKAARIEYNNVWMGESWKNQRKVHHGLSRYYDINDIHFLAELESGWDLTSRFLGRCMDILPIDLNVLLYKYELDFAETALILAEENHQDESKYWKETAANRQNKINELMWDESTGIFRDFDYVNLQQTQINSLAAFFPMYFNLASKQQAEALVNNLALFDHMGGLTTTSNPATIIKDEYMKDKSHVQQWDYPNGWANLHWIVIKGLLNYGYEKEARQIADKWLRTCEMSFDQHGFFMEKYNVVDPTEPANGHYQIQEGFGWTNAVYKLLSDQFRPQ